MKSLQLVDAIMVLFLAYQTVHTTELCGVRNLAVEAKGTYKRGFRYLRQLYTFI